VHTAPVLLRAIAGNASGWLSSRRGVRAPELTGNTQQQQQAAAASQAESERRSRAEREAIAEKEVHCLKFFESNSYISYIYTCVTSVTSIDIGSSDEVESVRYMAAVLAQCALLSAACSAC
jgi:hypothetical protein